MKNTQKGSSTVAMLVIVIVVLLGAIGYLYFRATQPQVSEITSRPISDQQIANELTPTTLDLLTYSGKTDTGVNFSIMYPTSWTYYKFSCNANGVAFWPKSSAPNFSQGGACSMNSFLESAPIILSTMSSAQLDLRNTSYQTVFNQMKASLK